jgi:hypothetical protein
VGLLKHLLFWPVTGPTYLTRFSLEKVEGAVRSELTDDTPVKQELMELQMQLELGDIDDDQYVAREAEIMRRLRDVRHWREQFGMATAGGLVKVAAEGAEDSAEGAEDAAEQGEEPGAGSPPAPYPDDDRTPRVARPGEAEVELSFDFDEE